MYSFYFAFLQEKLSFSFFRSNIKKEVNESEF